MPSFYNMYFLYKKIRHGSNFGNFSIKTVNVQLACSIGNGSFYMTCIFRLYLTDLQKHQAKGTAFDSFSGCVTHCLVSTLCSLEVQPTVNYVLSSQL